MKTTSLIMIASLILFCGCEHPDPNVDLAGPAPADTSTKATSGPAPAADASCKAGEHLVYEDEGFSTYTEDKIRGTGVVSITLEVNDRLDIYNEDGTLFGFLVLNDDMTYYTLDMPKRLLARKVVPEFDFAAFDFDADKDNSGAKYLYVYANKQRKKILKEGLKYQYQSWNEYLKLQPISLKPCNKLANAPSLDPDILFNINSINGDEIKIRSSKDCGGEDAPYAKAEGTVRWRKGDELLVNLETCN